MSEASAAPASSSPTAASWRDLTRARILAGIRVNAVVVNNVNANYTTPSTENIHGLRRIADVFRPCGVQLGLSLYFATPMNLSSLPTFHPFDEQVIQWWNDKTDEIYEKIPDMAGYLVKPTRMASQDHYTSIALSWKAPTSLPARCSHTPGSLIFHAFVYDSTGLNESICTDDRAIAAVDFSRPLFAHLRRTNAAIELQVTQAYLGPAVPPGLPAAAGADDSRL